MKNKLYPDLYVNSIYEIDLEYLKKNGKKVLLMDIDNTMVGNFVREPSKELIEWVEKVKSYNLELCILSNAKKERVLKFNKDLNLNFICKASKPTQQGYKKACDILNCKKNEMVMVGDQIFTDVLGGNIFDILTILVKPIDKKELWYIRVKRLPEKIVLHFYKKSKRNHL